jgi:ribosomal protein L11 methylase PrmA
MAGSAAQLMVELRLQCPQDQVEQISDALMALDALSVSVEDADCFPPRGCWLELNLTGASAPILERNYHELHQ